MKMPFFDFFGRSMRDIFGLPPSDDPNFSKRYSNQFMNPYDNDDDDDNYENRDPFTSDPFGMHGFFSHDFSDFHNHMVQQMDEMRRLFDEMLGVHSGDMSPSIGGFEGVFDDDNKGVPMIENNIRDQYLKPGYQSKSHIGNNAADTDLDGIIAPNDLNDLIRGHENPIQKRSPTIYSKTIVMRTITKPDGTTETRRTVKDNTTNEEETTITVTQKNDDFDNIIVPGGSKSDGSILWRKFFKF